MTATEIPVDLETALAERYTLRRVLGRGGMATVYLADDKKHRRAVAIKVLLPGLAAYLGVERFLKEIQIAARLTHPHILALHDSGEAAGFLYYVMPYIEGGSLRQQLEGAPRRTLSHHQALAVAEPVASALSYAQRMGVLHRDIKPENILFQQGLPIVADFGIAKAVSTAGGANITRTGFPVGTPGYMSPEQAAGVSELDERTDVYSLAVVIYEMLVGEVPGRWPTEDAVRAGRFLEATPSHRTRLTTVGPRIEAALVRGLAIRHDQRTATPDVLMDDLIRGPSGARRRYDRDEVDEIVKRATEMEATNKTASGAMTIGGVEEIAGEVGVKPELVRQAAESLRRPSTPNPPPSAGRPANQPNPWISGPTRLMFERLVDGELPESEYETVVDEIRQVLQDAGQVTQFGRSFTWSSQRPGSNSGVRRNLEITVSIRGGRTRVTIQENLSNLIGGVFGGIGGGMGGGGMGPVMGLLGGVLHLGALTALFIPVWLGATYATARYVYRRSTSKKSTELEQLADRLASLVADLVVVPHRLKP